MLSRLQVFAAQIGWNDKECDAGRRYICRRPCPTEAPEPPSSQPSEPGEQVKLFNKIMLAGVVAVLTGAMLVMVLGIKFERSKIRGLEQRLLFVDEQQKGYRTSSKGMKATGASEITSEQQPSL